MSFELLLANITQNTRIDDFQDQTGTLVCQCESDTGVRDAQLNFAPGFASKPVKGDRVILTEINSALYAIAGASQKVEGTLNFESGERIIFSTDADGNLSSYLKIKNDATIHLNGDKDFAVRYGPLAEVINDLKDKWNTFANAYVPGGPSAVGAPPSASAVTKTVEPAKIEEIKVP